MKEAAQTNLYLGAESGLLFWDKKDKHDQNSNMIVCLAPDITIMKKLADGQSLGKQLAKTKIHVTVANRQEKSE